MDYALQKRPAPAGSVIDALRAEGVSEFDINVALALQKTQRNARVPVLSLRVICGREEHVQAESAAFGAASNLGRGLPEMPRRRPGRGGLHITRNRVWANSVRTGSENETNFAKPLTKPLRARLVTACKRALDLGNDLATQARAGKRVLSEREKKLVCLTPSCLRVLTELINNEEYRKGWVIPAYETIAKWAHLSRSTIHRALHALADVGLIEWIRRFDYAFDQEHGARSTQTSNLYRFTLPDWLAKLIKIDPPVPVDDAHRRTQSVEDHAAMMAGTAQAQTSWPTFDKLAPRTSLGAQANCPDQPLRPACSVQECQEKTAPPIIYLYSKKRDDGSALSADTLSPDGPRKYR